MKRFAMLALVGTLSGCVGGYYSPTQPTHSSVVQHKGQMFKGTYYSKQDYKEDGKLKTFSEYDFLYETAPCTVIGGAYKENQDTDTVYSVKLDGYDLHFFCRDRNTSLNKNENRLVLIGSYADCKTRTWDYSKSVYGMYKELARLCNYNREPVVKNLTYKNLYINSETIKGW